MVNELAIVSAKEAAGSAHDAKINMDEVGYFIETGDIGRAVQQIEWAIKNSENALRNMKKANKELKTNRKTNG